MQTEDVSTEFLVKFWPWFEANRKRLIVIGVILLAGLFVWYYLKTSRDERELAAGQAYTQFQLDQPQTETAQQVAAGYLKIAREYSGTIAAQRSQLQAAAILFSASHYADARTQFENFVQANPGNPMVATARLGVAACEESLGKLNDALSLYRQVAVSGQDTTEGVDANFSAGRILELQGKLADAVSAYQQVMQSPLAGSLGSEAANRVAMIQGKLAAQKGATKPVVTPVAKPAAKKS